MAPHIEPIVRLALSQTGDPYVFGVENKAEDPNPDAHDCSELIEWDCDRNLVTPKVPDGSWLQARHCQLHRTLVPVTDALDTRGALLFRFSADPFSGGRPSDAHVAISLGDGHTVEARGRDHGVGVFGGARLRRWTHAARIPGVDYTSASPETVPSVGAEVHACLVPGGQARSVDHPTDAGQYPMWGLGADGGVFAFNGAQFHGSLPGYGVRIDNAVHIASGGPGGYYVIGADGGVFGFGDHRFPGSLPALGIRDERIIGAEVVDAAAGHVTLLGAHGKTFDLQAA